MLLGSRIDLWDASEAAARPLRSLAAQKRIRMELDGEFASAHADSERVWQVLSNLIEIRDQVRRGTAT